MKVLSLLLGVLFGFILVRAGATSYDLITNMFLFKNLHLMFVILSAIVVAFIGLTVIRKFNVKTIDGKEIKITPKGKHIGNIIGGLIFGAGWAVTGSCPGTILGQLGEGKLAALFSFTGMILGTYLYGVMYPRLEKMMKSDKK